MLIASIGLVAAAITIWRAVSVRERPLDPAELQFIRRFGDQIRKEQIHFFE
jgi:hypothetical protein